MGERGVVLQLGYEPAPGQMVIEDDRITAVRKRRRAATELAETAKSTPKRMDRRRPELQCAARLVIDRDGHVYHLHELRSADGAIRVWGDERETEQIAIVLRALPIEVEEAGNTSKRAGERRCHRVGVRVGDHRTRRTRCRSLAVTPSAARRGADYHL